MLSQTAHVKKKKKKKKKTNNLNQHKENTAQAESQELSAFPVDHQAILNIINKQSTNRKQTDKYN